MDLANDNLLARGLLTLVTLGYGLVPAIVDFNRTHATNPLWTPHARFHVVWQVLSYCGVALIALGLIWTAGGTGRLWIAVGLAASAYAGFFGAVFSRPLFGGTLTDTNGVPPIGTVTVGSRPVLLDANVTFFGAMVVLLAIAAVLIR
jgi:hypothetical protein